MEYLSVKEEDLKRMLHSENWVSTIGSMKGFTAKIDSLLMHDFSDSKFTQFNFKSISLVEVMGDCGDYFFVRIDINHLARAEKSVDNNDINIELLNGLVSSCSISRDPLFIQSLQNDQVRVISANGFTRLDNFLNMKKIHLVSLINYRALNEAIRWVFVQRRQINKQLANGLKKSA